MWVLPSRGRPHNIKRLISSYLETGASTPVWLRLDEDDPSLGGYLEIDYPSNWHLSIGERKPLSGYYNEFYEKSDCSWYGFIADDVVPKTQYWDTKLIAAAGHDGMGAPKGGHEDTNVIPHFVLGGDLVRSVGFLCLPGLDRIYIDTVWNDIALSRGVLRYTDAELKHTHFSNGAPMDKTYQKHHKSEDRELYDQWRQDEYTS